MSLEENKAIALRHFEEAYENLDVIDEIYDKNTIGHLSSQEVKGSEGMKKYILANKNAFPDVKFIIEDQIAEGDKVVGRVTFRGTHKGEFMGISPTGKEITVESIEINRISDGKFVEHWEVFDQLGMMQQLGIVSPPE